MPHLVPLLSSWQTSGRGTVFTQGLYGETDRGMCSVGLSPGGFPLWGPKVHQCVQCGAEVQQGNGVPKCGLLRVLRTAEVRPAGLKGQLSPAIGRADPQCLTLQVAPGTIFAYIR